MAGEKLKNAFFGFPVIDVHTHLRNDIPGHTKIAAQNGIDSVVYMANCLPPLDDVCEITESLQAKRCCHAHPVSAITKRLAGKELVDMETLKKLVVGFSDDGNCLTDLELFAEALKKNVLLMMHAEPETEYVGYYLEILAKTGGKLHIQHVSLVSSVNLIRDFKKEYKKELENCKMQLTAETCPHYAMFSKEDLETKVNPPLATKKDVHAIRKGLADGTIDIIASDYAPLPRITGIAGFRSFLPLSFGLFLNGVLTLGQLKEKLFLNPLKIVRKTEYLKA